MAKKQDNRQQIFLSMADEYKGIIAKVCSVYASGAMPFADLYQEVMANLWTGLDSFRGEAKASTWIYRIALNTCITLHRKNKRHSNVSTGLEGVIEIPDDSSSTVDDIQILYGLIGKLDAIDRALVMLWLDEKSYEEIAAVIGISKANVATRLFRAKQRLAALAESLEQ